MPGSWLYMLGLSVVHVWRVFPSYSGRALIPLLKHLMPSFLSVLWPSQQTPHFTTCLERFLCFLFSSYIGLLCAPETRAVTEHHTPVLPICPFGGSAAGSCCRSALWFCCGSIGGQTCGLVAGQTKRCWNSWVWWTQRGPWMDTTLWRRSTFPVFPQWSTSEVNN